MREINERERDTHHEEKQMEREAQRQTPTRGQVRKGVDDAMTRKIKGRKSCERARKRAWERLTILEGTTTLRLGERIQSCLDLTLRLNLLHGAIKHMCDDDFFVKGSTLGQAKDTIQGALRTTARKNTR